MPAGERDARVGDLDCAPVVACSEGAQSGRGEEPRYSGPASDMSDMHMSWGWNGLLCNRGLRFPLLKNLQDRTPLYHDITHGTLGHCFANGKHGGRTRSGASCHRDRAAVQNLVAPYVLPASPCRRHESR